MAVNWVNKPIAEKIERQAQGMRQVGALGVVEGDRLDDGRQINSGFLERLFGWLRPRKETKASFRVVD